MSAISIGPVYDNSLVCSQCKIFKPPLWVQSPKFPINFQLLLFTKPKPHWNPLFKLAKTCKQLGLLRISIKPPSHWHNSYNHWLLKEPPISRTTRKGINWKITIEPGKLVNLRRLALAGNQITGQIPASIGGLTKLLIFDLSRNNLSGSMLLTLGKLAPLLKLDLSYNNLQEKIPKEIGNLHNVTIFGPKEQ